MRASPATVAHADWSNHRRKRWVAVATSRPDGGWIASEPEQTGTGAVLAQLRVADFPKPVLAGVDFPIGVPRAYAGASGIGEFNDLLSELGRGRWADVFEPAATLDEVRLERPFFPLAPRTAGEGDKARHRDRLGLSREEVLRRCDRLARAESLFWTVGAKQVGKAATAGWRELLLPALADGQPSVGIWPFDDPSLEQLLRYHDVVIAETYPAALYRRVGVVFRSGQGGKTSQRARAAQAASIGECAERLGVKLTTGLRDAIAEGFAKGQGGDDGFDAVAGLLGMLDVVAGERPGAVPRDDAVLTTEGWMLGLLPTG